MLRRNPRPEFHQPQRATHTEPKTGILQRLPANSSGQSLKGFETLIGLDVPGALGVQKVPKPDDQIHEPCHCGMVPSFRLTTMRGRR